MFLNLCMKPPCYNILMFGSKAVPWVAILLVIVIIAPSIALGAGMPSQIVPCSGTSANGGTECNVCSLVTLAQNILNTAIYVAVFLSAFLFAYAGWEYATAGGNSGKAGHAKEIFWNVLMGLVVMLVGYLIIDTIMRTLVNAQLLPWSNIC